MAIDPADHFIVFMAHAAGDIHKRDIERNHHRGVVMAQIMEPAGRQLECCKRIPESLPDHIRIGLYQLPRLWGGGILQQCFDRPR